MNRAKRNTKVQKSKKDFIFCTLIIILGAILRVHSYNSVPPPGWQHDEYAFTWGGMSLIQNQTPTSWSWLKSYGDVPIEKWKGNEYRLVTPWFDHPPLYGLILGATSIYTGATSLFDVSLTYIRIPSLIFGILSIYLLYILAKKLFGTKVAVLSSLIFATSPAIVLFSRVAVSENFIVVLSLATVLSILKFFEVSENKYLYLSAVFAGLASMTKITGIFMVLFLFSFLIYKKRWKQSIIALLIGVALFSTYFIYGWIYDPNLFMSVLVEHSARFKNLIIVDNILIKTLIGLPFIDVWSIFGWIILIPVALNKKIEIITLPIITYLFVLLISGAQGHFYSWYMIPFFPFLSIVLGIFFSGFIERIDFVSASLVLIFIGGWCLHYLFVDSRTALLFVNFNIFKYVFIFIFLLIISLFFYYSKIATKKNQLLQDFTKILIGIFIVSNIIITFNLQNLFR